MQPRLLKLKVKIDLRNFVIKILSVSKHLIDFESEVKWINNDVSILCTYS